MIPASSHGHQQHLSFRRADLHLAAPMKHLHEVISVASLRPLPGAEPALAGFMALRGRVLPVLDPALLIDLAPNLRLRSGIVLVVGPQNEPCFGLLAEAIGKVMELPAPRPLTFPARLPASFTGETGEGHARLLLLDVVSLAAAMGLAGAARAAADSHLQMAC